jgi:hypothetical protein
MRFVELAPPLVGVALVNVHISGKFQESSGR